MKNYLIGGLVTIAILGLFSYTSTNGGNTEHNARTIYNIPLKQKKVVTTEDIKYVNRLVQKGYVVQFVTEKILEFENGYAEPSRTTYTLIKY